MEDNNMTSILLAIVSAIGTFLVTKVNSKSTIEKTNAETAKSLYEQYERANQKLQEKVDKLEHKIDEMKEKYEKEIAFYQAKVEELEDENESLMSELERFKGGE